MVQFVDLTKQEPLLTTHDCVYFKNPLPASVIVDATILLQQTFPYLRFEEQEIVPIMEDDLFNARYADFDNYEKEHKQLIVEQEALAPAYIKLKAERLK